VEIDHIESASATRRAALVTSDRCPEAGPLAVSSVRAKSVETVRLAVATANVRMVWVPTIRRAFPGQASPFTESPLTSVSAAQHGAGRASTPSPAAQGCFRLWRGCSPRSMSTPIAWLAVDDSVAGESRLVEGRGRVVVENDGAGWQAKCVAQVGSEIHECPGNAGVEDDHAAGFLCSPGHRQA